MSERNSTNRFNRREALRIGSLGATGLTLASYLQAHAAMEFPKSAANRNAIFVELTGGPSHLDTFDLKPKAPAEIRGKFKAISTKVPGIEICEHLPKLAMHTDKFTIIRGVSHSLGAHSLGQKFLFTGNRPNPALDYPAYGSVAAKELRAPADLPSYVAIPQTAQGPGYLGVKYSPLATNEVPVKGRPFNVRGIALGAGVTLTEIERRRDLLRDLDQTFAAIERESELLDGLDEFSRKAFRMITSKRTRDAFDVSQEPESYLSQFAEDPFSQSCLLATRLIEAGVRFVTVNLSGWDTHADNFIRLKENLLPRLDAGLSGLFWGLAAKGLLESTTVFVTGEFGRTPKINDRTPDGGRDHYPRCMFMLMGGGNIRGGQVLGASDEHGAAPLHEGFKPEDVAATFYQALGISPTLEYQTPTGRPVMLVREGRVLGDLLL